MSACTGTSPGTTVNNCSSTFSVESLGQTPTSAGVEYSFRVCKLGTGPQYHDLSHFSLDLDTLASCAPAGASLSSSFVSCAVDPPSTGTCSWLARDPTTQIGAGVKFDNLQTSGACGTYRLTLSGAAAGFQFGSGAVLVATKASQEDIRRSNRPSPGYACIQGPVCQPTTNQPPVFSSAPVTSATEDQPYSYAVLASDPEGGALSYALTTAPSGMAISASGVISWTPSAAQVGTNAVVVEVTDAGGLKATQAFTVTVAAVNDVPIAAADQATVAEDGTVDVPVLANDQDPDGDALTIQLLTAPAHGTTTVLGALVRYIPAPNYFGSDTFTYEAVDPSGARSAAQVQLTITAVNDPPVAQNDVASTTEDGSVDVAVLANDSDVDGDSLAVRITVSPLHGTASVVGNVVRYVPSPNYSGPDVFTYAADDPAGATDSAQVQVTVAAANDAPVALNDSATVPEDGTVTIPVLANDSDVDGDALTIRIIAAPEHGTTTVAGHLVHYTPNPNFFGADSFAYEAEDPSGARSNTAAVSVQVTPVNDTPVAVNDSATVLEGSSVDVDVLANDSDVDGDTLIIRLVQAPAHGSATVVGTSVRYVPAAQYSGPDNFTYEAEDPSGARSNVAQVELQVTDVNHPPVAVNDTATVPEDETIDIPVLANDQDPDGDSLSIRLVQAPSHGTATVSGTVVRYVPAPNYFGADTLRYEAEDLAGARSASAEVQIQVTPVNDPPIAVFDAATVSEDGTVDVAVLANDSDVDGDSLTVRIVTAPAHGTATIVGGLVRYAPAPHYHGADVLTYVAEDPSNASSAAVELQLTITPVNDAPVALADSATLVEDGSAEVDVLANDLDVDGDALSIHIVEAPTYGTATVFAGGIRYTPQPNYFGTDTLRYVARDPSGAESTPTEVTLQIAGQNDPPVAFDDTATLAEDTTIDVAVLANDTDADGDTLSVELVTLPAHGTATLVGGVVRYVPAANYAGPDAFTYVAEDPAGAFSAVARVELTITPVNDAPVAVDDSATVLENGSVDVFVLANDSDADGDPLLIRVLSGPSQGTATVVGQALRYVPNPNFAGRDVINYQIEDPSGATSIVASVEIFVTQVNEAPVAVDDTASVAEDGTVDIPVLANDTDADGDTLIVRIISSPSHGLATVVGNQIRYTPAPQYSGGDALTYVAEDSAGASSNVAQVLITVGATQDAPVAFDDSAQGQEDQVLLVLAPGLLANDSDPDGDTLTVRIVHPPAHGVLVADPDGGYRYTPDPHFSGTDSFLYVAEDAFAASNVATVTLTISPLADAPVAHSDTASVAEDVELVVAAPGVLANDESPDGVPLTARLVQGPTHGTLVLAADGGYRYTPQANYHGSDSFRYAAEAGALASEAVVTIVVLPVADAPVAFEDSIQVEEDEVYQAASVLLNDVDADGDALTAHIVSYPIHGALNFRSDGTFLYIAPAPYVGPDSFTYVADDGALLSSATTVHIQVTELVAPRAVADAQFALEDQPLSVPADRGVLINDRAPLGDVLSAVVETGPAHGTLALASDGGYVYTPAPDFSGLDSFIYRVVGSTGSSTAAVTLRVNPVNDAPVATSDAYSTVENGLLLVEAPGPLANDLDPEGRALSMFVVVQPTLGTITWSPDGRFVYRPNLAVSGTDTFQYRAIDAQGASATAQVTIEIPPKLPDPAPDQFTTPEDIALQRFAADGVRRNDADQGADFTVYAILTTATSHGSISLGSSGDFVYLPDPNYVGPDTFGYRLTDGLETSPEATVSLTVTPRPDAPTAFADFYTTPEDTALDLPSPGVLGNDEEPDQEPLTAFIVAAPTRGVVLVRADGGFRYTPFANVFGPDTFTYVASDGVSFSAAEVVTIDVASVNDAPVFTPPRCSSSAFVAVAFTCTLQASDVEQDALAYAVVSGPAGVTVDANGQVSWTPLLAQVGLHTITIEVQDLPGGAAQTTFQVEVTEANAPAIVSTAPRGAVPGQIYTYAITVQDPDNSVPFTYTVLQGPGSAAIDASGVLTWTPAATDVGNYTFRVQVTDAQGLSDEQTFVVESRSGLVPDLSGLPQTCVAARAYGASQYRGTFDSPFRAGLESGDLQFESWEGGIWHVTGVSREPGRISSAYGFEPRFFDSIDLDDSILDGTCAGNACDSFWWEGLSGFDFTFDPVLGRYPEMVGLAWTDGPGSGEVDVIFEAYGPDGRIIAETRYPTLDFGFEGTARNGTLEDRFFGVRHKDGVRRIRLRHNVSPGGIEVDHLQFGGCSSNAEAALIAAGFELGRVRYLASTEVPAGVVLTQGPAPGTLAPAGDRVDLVVSIGPKNSPPMFWRDDTQVGTYASTPITLDVRGADYDFDDTLHFGLDPVVEGLSIDGNGVLTANFETGGLRETTVVVSDGRGYSARRPYAFEVLDGAAPPPFAFSSAPTSLDATAGEAYVYDANTVYEGILPYAYALVTAPAGMVIDSKTGVLSWIPLEAEAGSHPVTIALDDKWGVRETQSFDVTVAAAGAGPVAAPVFTSTPPRVALPNAPWDYVVRADLGLRYELIEGPAGLTQTGASLFSWLPKLADAGMHDVVIRATSLSGATTQQHFELLVYGGELRITSRPQLVVEPGQPYEQAVTVAGAGSSSVAYALVLGPMGMTLSPAGVLNWSPTAADLGAHEVVVRVDVGAESVRSYWTLQVVEENEGPEFVSSPTLAAQTGTLYGYQVEVTDPTPGDSIRVTLETGPAGMLLSPSNQLRWLPSSSQAGTHTVTLRATDSAGLFATQSFDLVVTRVNAAPVITSLPPNDAQVRGGQTFTHQIVAVDPNPENTLTYSVSGLAGMTIDSAGLIRFTPAADAAGEFFPRVRVVDSTGLFVEQSFRIVVVPATAVPPRITSTPVLRVTARTLYAYALTVTDPDPYESFFYNLVELPNGMQVNNSGLITWRPTDAQVGAHAVRVAAEDQYFLSTEQAFVVEVLPWTGTPPASAHAPVITSSPKLWAVADTSYFDQVVASDADLADVLAYELTAAPSGMSIHPIFGNISWYPSQSEVGTHEVEITVSDLFGYVTTQSYTLTVLPSNDAPVFVSTPPTTVIQDDTLVYTADVLDSDPGEVLTFGLVNGPEGATLDASTGVLTWTPGTEDVGTVAAFDLVVVDRAGAIGFQNFYVAVLDRNDPPAFVGAPPSSVIVYETYTAQLTATDPDAGDSRVFSKISGPSNLVVNESGGMFWIPEPADIGSHLVVLRVTDASGLFDELTFDLEVLPDPQTPVVTVTTEPEFVDVGSPVLITVTATDREGPPVRSLTVAGLPVALDAFGQATFTPNAPGTYVVVGTAIDTSGNVGSKTSRLVGKDSSDLVGPMVELRLPAEDEVVTEPVEVIGTVMDTNLVEYELSLARGENGAFTAIHRAATQALDSTVGRLDPTLLENGIYRLRLSAVDINGATAESVVPIRIDGGMKVGVFTLSFTDLSIPVSGIPITVTRTYDSRVKTQHDFGIGWKLDVTAGSYEHNRVPGEGWQFPPQPAPGEERFFIPCVTKLNELKSHRTEIRLSEREVYTFALRLTNGERIAHGCLAQAEFVQVGGWGPSATLDIIGNLGVVYQFDDDVVRDDFTLEVYNPHEVRLTTHDGRVVDFERGRGITRLEDQNGNALYFLREGIVHSSGKSISFERDGLGRISRIVDPMGHTLEYAYDSAGDLVRFADQADNETQFTYDTRHNLVDIINPLGVRAVRSEYDDAGRLIATIDTSGSRMAFDHDIAARRQTITNRLGYSTYFDYDTRGNVVRETYPGSPTVTIERTFDARDNLLSQTDELGYSTSWTYDASNNKLTETNPLNQTRSWTYDDGGRVTTETDGRGEVTRHAYDARGLLRSTIDPESYTTILNYDVYGNLTEECDGRGFCRRSSYDQFGQMLRDTNRRGVPTLFTYDENGRLQTETTTRSVAGTVETMTTTHVYDELGRETEVHHPDGSVTHSEYDPRGLMTRTIDALGRATTYAYNDEGRRTLVTYPDGTTESDGYDAEGRRISHTNRLGRATTYAYDDRGRLTRTTFDGASRLYGYDRAGRMTSTTDRRGFMSTSVFDAAGRLVESRNRLEQPTTMTYDGAGNTLTVTDARGTTTNTYDRRGMLVDIEHPDGTHDTQVFDAAGNLVAKTDPEDRITHYEFDGDGNLISVTNPANETWTFEYDARSNLVAQTDPLGHTTRFEHDAMGRETSRRFAVGPAQTRRYDLAGNLTRRVNYSGAVTEYRYDVNNRMTMRLQPEGAISMTYSPTGRRLAAIDSRGSTTYSYDVHDRLASVTYPEGRGISYAYDPEGNLASMTVDAGLETWTETYAHDAEGRITSVLANGETFGLAYDALGRLETLSYPNGLTTRYTYDPRDRVMSIVVRNTQNAVVSSLEYTRLPSGNISSILEQDGTLTEYEHDPADRLTLERVSVGGGTQSLRGFAYDRAGNRVEVHFTPASGSPDVQLCTLDERDRLLTQGDTTFTWDEDGRLLSRSGPDGFVADWDSEDRLLGLHFASTEEQSHRYDLDGLRTRMTRTSANEGAQTVEFLVDHRGELGHVVAEIASGSQIRARYIRANDHLLSVRRSGETRYMHGDHIGSTRLMTDSTGEATDSFKYGSFGEVTEHLGEDSNPYLFTGEEFDPTRTLAFHRARWMLPSVGRFMSRDPCDGTPFDPATRNAYA